MASKSKKPNALKQPSATQDGDVGDVSDKYMLRPPFAQKFKPAAVKTLIHEVGSYLGR